MAKNNPYTHQYAEPNQYPHSFPPQHQSAQPGLEYLMQPRPIFDDPNYRGSGKLSKKVALITGGDSGIGRAVAFAFAKEGADIAISYLNEQQDAEETKAFIESHGRKCLLIAGDLRDQTICKKVVEDTITTFGQLDVLVNNAAVQYPQYSLEDISSEQLEDTFRVNIFSFFHVTKAALTYLKSGSTIINTASVTAFKGNEQLLDYSATKGAIVSFTRSLALSLSGKGIRVNGVAPGPVWTPLIPASFTADKVASFGSDTPLKRAGQPVELGPAYVFLASDDSAYATGQIIHINGGDFITA
ncbi:SDR family oxidoreductase [Sinanaerobacter chloroacetimidivorans]|uniref:SDR family oxidoreductase n=1 Tax=Sinanaerobacter chloroacetimidivorans TaxID=2818044 RepID=A0A8J7W1L6_9FIRM|nr:SDR family oxidoreductase [Sinanaerobacter chloroacetimidivorans]MBR0597913.1 SDR family oxidoreductase [Sinanaerobacter chloroacetimidivorans]